MDPNQPQNSNQPPAQDAAQPPVSPAPQPAPAPESAVQPAAPVATPQPQAAYPSAPVAPAVDPQTAPQSPNAVSKAQHNIAVSLLVAGWFFAVVDLLLLVFMVMTPSKATPVKLVSGALFLLVGVYYIVQGNRIKKNTDKASVVKSVTMSMVISLVLFVLAVVGGVIDHSNAGLNGIIALVVGVYLAIENSRLKKSA